MPDRKKRGNPDRLDFACTESWEVDYLIAKIKKVYPVYSETNIRSAIAQCCKSVGSQHPRDKFVTCVMQRLRS